MLAEATTTEFSKVEQPQGLEENMQVARAGGSVAGDARRSIEARTGRAVATSGNAESLATLMVDAIDVVAALPDAEEEGEGQG